MDIIRVKNLEFRYASRNASPRDCDLPREGRLRDMTLRIHEFVARAGERIVVTGSNGAGKSTFLSILGGRKLVTSRSASIRDRDCFNDCSLASIVCYLGDWWRSDFFLDATVRAFLGPSIVENKRCTELCEILQVNLDWRISRLSDGQRRRCQILTGLVSSESFEVYILDEVTADLDIVSRERLLQWLKGQSEIHGAVVLLATHIMDGIDDWATRVVFMDSGIIKNDHALTEIENLYATVRGWVFESYDVVDSKR